MSEQGQQDQVSEGATGSPKQEAVETSFSTYDLPPNIRLASVKARLDSMDTRLDSLQTNMETILQLLLARAKSAAPTEDKPTERQD